VGADALAQRARAVAVNDDDVRLARERGAIHVRVDRGHRLVAVLAADVDRPPRRRGDQREIVALRRRGLGLPAPLRLRALAARRLARGRPWRAQLVGPTCVASVYRAGVRGTCGLVVSRQASSDFVQLHDVEHFDLTVPGVIPDLKSRTEHVTKG